jgi:hypothetical protein
MPWRPEFGPGGRHFVSGNSYLLFGGSSEAAMGGGARSAPLGVAKSPKRRVRAAHGRAHGAKTH